MAYKALVNRYEKMIYNRCGNSGIKLSAISLGLWHNFGNVDNFKVGKDIVLTAFDNGVTHFDLANNYGPPPGSAEKNFGKILREQIKSYRDELIISTKAGYGMWPGPYGDWGSRKYLMASIDQSLKRMGVDYVDVFYSHRPDPETPIEETMGALDAIVRQGKALYVGISNYSPEETEKAVAVLNDLGTPCLIHQPKFSMFHRIPEEGLFDTLLKIGIGCIPFSPLAQGLLTNKYLNGIPTNSRAAKEHGFLQKDSITEELINKIQALNKLAEKRDQTLAQMALAWVLHFKAVTTVLVGASSVAQLKDSLKCLDNLEFTKEELSKIEEILK